jgi:L-asparaginase / beta-aspartyl-peptidase
MFMRYGVAFEIAARMRHAGLSLGKAARDVIHELGELGGQGGIIAIGGTGAPALLFNTAGMYRGYVLAEGKIHTAILGEPYQER